MLQYGDGGGLDRHSGGGDDSAYHRNGGGYTVHQLQLNGDAAGELNALMNGVKCLIRAADPDGVSVSNKGGGWHSSGNLMELSCQLGDDSDGLDGDSVSAYTRADEQMCSDAVRQLRAAIDEAVILALPQWPSETGPGRRPIRAWLNENSAGNYNNCHTHGVGFSGVYYVHVPGVSSGDDEDTEIELGRATTKSCGCLAMRTWSNSARSSKMVLGQERGASGAAHYSLIRPAAGMLLLFPSALEHAVLPFYINNAPTSKRLSVAFNI